MMTCVVQSPCVNCKYGDCVDVCPVNCFYEGEEMLVINPEECIGCGACIPACPVEAIVDEQEAEEKWVRVNAEFNFSEETRRFSQNEVTQGPNWNKDLA